MTTTAKPDTDFRSALSTYHAALAHYQSAVAAIEDEGRTVQLRGREQLARVNQAALDAGSRATCAVRATVDARILALDIDSGSAPADKHAVKHAVVTLDARIALLEVAIRELEAAREALEKHLKAIAQSARDAKDALCAHKLHEDA